MRLTAACLFGALAVALAAPAGAAPIPKDQPKTNAEKIVGTWKLVSNSKETPKDVTYYVEFAKDGKMTLRAEPTGDGEKMTFTGKYKVDGDKIDYELTIGDNKKQEILTIKKLTDDELVTVDPDDIKEEFKRVKEEKKKEEDKKPEKN